MSFPRQYRDSGGSRDSKWTVRCIGALCATALCLLDAVQCSGATTSSTFSNTRSDLSQPVSLSSTQFVSWSGNRGVLTSLTLTVTKPSASRRSASTPLTMTQTLLATVSGSTDTTVSPSESPTVTGATQSRRSTASFAETQTHVSLSRSDVSHSTTSSSTPLVSVTATRTASMATSASLSLTVASKSRTRSASAKWPSFTSSLLSSVSNSSTPFASASASGVVGRHKGLEDATVTATRSPSFVARHLGDSHTTTWQETQVRTSTASMSIPDVSFTSSSSNFLPGKGINNPLLYERPRFGFFADPRRCSPSVLLIQVVPLASLALVGVVWLWYSRCGEVLPYDRDRNPTLYRVGPLRYMIAHHAYLSCLMPCHLRCAALHIVELMAHMSVSLLVLLALLTAFTPNRPPTLGLLACASLFAVVIASAVRHPLISVGWTPGEVRTFERCVPTTKRHRVKYGWTPERLYEGTSSSEEELSFPTEFDRKPKKTRKPRGPRSKDIHDYVKSYVDHRKQRSGSYTEADAARDVGFVDSGAEDVLELRREALSSPLPRADELSDDNIPPPPRYPSRPPPAPSSGPPLGFVAHVTPSNEQHVVSSTVYVEDIPVPEWDDIEAEVATRHAVDEAFSQASRLPDAKGSVTLLHGRKIPTAEVAVDYIAVAVGANYVIRCLVIHIAVWVGSVVGCFVLSSVAERSLGSTACGVLPQALLVQFVVWDLGAVQTFYALYRGHRAGAWQCGCTIVIDEREHRTAAARGPRATEAGAHDASERGEGRQTFDLHPRY